MNTNSDMVQMTLNAIAGDLVFAYSILFLFIGLVAVALSLLIVTFLYVSYLKIKRKLYERKHGLRPLV